MNNFIKLLKEIADIGYIQTIQRQSEGSYRAYERTTEKLRLLTERSKASTTGLRCIYCGELRGRTTDSNRTIEGINGEQE